MKLSEREQLIWAATYAAAYVDEVRWLRQAGLPYDTALSDAGGTAISIAVPRR